VSASLPTDKEEKNKPEKEKSVVPIAQRLAWTLDECAAMTGFKVCALRAAIWAGELAFIRSGERGRYLIRRETLEKFVRSREQQEAA